MISRAIRSLCPDAEFAIENEDYSTIRWFKQPETIPTLEEVENEIQRLLQLDVDLSYQRKRKVEYPHICDQLDMFWHMMDNETIPGKGSEWYNQILTVKTAYPKEAV